MKKDTDLQFAFKMMALVFASVVLMLIYRSFVGVKKVENPIDEIKKQIEEHYLFDYDESKLDESDCYALVESLGDSYSMLMPYIDNMDIDIDENNFYVYVGMYLSFPKGEQYPEVINVVKGQNAEKAGLKEGDLIVTVDSKETTETDAVDVYKLFQGDINTEVKLTVRRGDEELEVATLRQKKSDINIEYKMLDNQIGYIKIKSFHGDLIKQFKEAVLDLESQDCKAYVFDVRDNAGGKTDLAVEICDIILPVNVLVCSLIDKNGNRSDYLTDDAEAIEAPMAVLINGHSASSSEVFTLCLKENNNAIVLGEKSFGKGIAQEDYVSSQGILRLTSFYWYSSLGVNIHKVGICPDIVITDDENTEEDEVLIKAIESLSK